MTNKILSVIFLLVLFSRTTFEKLIQFLRQHAVKGIQQEPINYRKRGIISPYSPESSAKNIYMIPLEKLASDEYNNLLSKKTFNNIVKKHSKEKLKSNNTQ